MNCRRMQQMMAAWSAGHLANIERAECEQHCAACPACSREWDLFQSTIFVVSVPSQPLPPWEVSRQMWSVCSENIFRGIEARRTPTGWEMTRHWARQQPRWGWVALGSAIVIFGSVWLLAPAGEAPVVVAGSPETGGPVMMIGQPRDFSPSANTGMRVQYSPPPQAAESVVNYHSSMPFDPFADRVGASMMPSPGEK